MDQMSSSRRTAASAFISGSVFYDHPVSNTP
jgi:hypothetical protein